MAEVLEITGIPEFQFNLKEVARTILEQLAAALYQEGLRILKLAQERTPVHTGALRDSARISQPQISDKEISITLSFGDETVTYAISVHEKINVRHISGRSKFLESVLLEESMRIVHNIAIAVQL